MAMKLPVAPLLTGLAANLLFVSCAAHNHNPPLASPPGPIYETAEQIKAMPFCRAKVVDRGPCFVSLRTAGGKGFYLGSPNSNPDVTLFLETLKDGKTYVLPDAFLQYQKHRSAP
jgi:hypothetical protein